MHVGYYALPLKLEDAYRKSELAKCSLKQSVAHHLHLMLTTSLGELCCDENYGSSIWEVDFDNLSSRSRLKDHIRQSTLSLVSSYEKRLENVHVEVYIQQEELPQSQEFSRIKKRLDIVITGTLRATNEDIVYRDSFFISPLSYN